MPIQIKKYSMRTKKYDRSKTRRYKKPSSKPSRLRVSATRARVNRQISKALTNFTESKFQGYSLDCGLPVAKPAGSQPISYFFYNTGQALAQAGNSMFVPMDLYNFPKGDGATERTGDYLFLKKTHMKLELQMLPTQGVNPTPQLSSTVQFRLMIVKANRKYNRLGESPLAGNSLFLTTQNEAFGFGIPGGGSTATVFANMSQPINKRKWLVYKDMKFTLSPPSQEYLDSTDPAGRGAINTAHDKYPVKKLISVDLPMYKKTYFDADSDTPNSIDTQWLLVIACCPTNYCTDNVVAPRNIRLNVLATTSATDS